MIYSMLRTFAALFVKAHCPHSLHKDEDTLGLISVPAPCVRKVPLRTTETQS